VGGHKPLLPRRRNHMTDKKTKDEIITEEVTTEEITNGNIQEDNQTSNEASDQKEVKTAKAGKRSAKAVAEAEEKVAKEERKASDEEEEVKPKRPVTPTRSRLERRGKAYRESAKAIEKETIYNLTDAIALAQKTSKVKFDATVELHVNLNVDPRHADQNIRDNLVLPAGTGKTIRIAVFADEDVKGVDLSGVENITKELDKGNINFDILIATPANMAKLGKYARVLGPRGLMPNPKSGTVTTDVAKAIEQAKAGRVEFRVDSTGIVHVGVGKVSFKPADLESNIRAVLGSLKNNKPASVKGTYVKAVHLTTTMGPSVTVATNEV
jgi:large subunit ribosomal protein L1